MQKIRDKRMAWPSLCTLPKGQTREFGTPLHI